MNRIKWILETSMTKTLAAKHGIPVRKVYEKFSTKYPDGSRIFREQNGATFGGMSFNRIKWQVDEMPPPPDLNILWNIARSNRSEVINRLLANKCELCGKETSLEAHHIRKLKDIDRGDEIWKQRMRMRKRKTLMICRPCHEGIHHGRYDGPAL
jgi:hypothetical protein